MRKTHKKAESSRKYRTILKDLIHVSVSKFSLWQCFSYSKRVCVFEIGLLVSFWQLWIAQKMKEFYKKPEPNSFASTVCENETSEKH